MQHGSAESESSLLACLYQQYPCLLCSWFASSFMFLRNSANVSVAPDYIGVTTALRRLWSSGPFSAAADHHQRMPAQVQGRPSLTQPRCVNCCKCSRPVVMFAGRSWSSRRPPVFDCIHLLLKICKVSVFRISILTVEATNCYYL